jgi:hypothetical protein
VEHLRLVPPGGAGYRVHQEPGSLEPGAGSLERGAGSGAGFEHLSGVPRISWETFGAVG